MKIANKVNEKEHSTDYIFAGNVRLAKTSSPPLL